MTPATFGVRPPDDRGRAGFKAVEGDFGNHFAAAEPRRHGIQQFAFAVQRANPVGPYSLWPENA
jgi:hypothetical protein